MHLFKCSYINENYGFNIYSHYTNHYGRINLHKDKSLLFYLFSHKSNNYKFLYRLAIECLIFMERRFNFLRSFLKPPSLSCKHVCIRRQFNNIIYSFIQERTFILCCGSIHSNLFMTSTGANDTQFTKAKVLRRVFSPFLFFSLVKLDASKSSD